MKDRNKRKLIIYVLVGVLMLTTVAYAALSTVLNVSGTVVKKGNLWNIYFTNPSSASIVGTATGSSINIQASSLNFQVSLYKPGDKVTYTVDIKNGGTIDAVLNSISLTGLDTAKSNSLNYTVTYSNGSTIKEGDTLNIGASRTIKITVEFDSSATSIPESDVNLTFGVTLIYGQSTSSSSTGTSGITSNNVIAGIYGESIQNGTPTPTSPVEIQSVGEKSTNLIPFNYTSRTKNGVTITVNNDGSLTYNGTATASVSYELFNGKMSLVEGKKYYFSDCYVQLNGQSGNIMTNGYTAKSGDYISLIWIWNESGTVFDNVVKKPMISNNQITSSNYEHPGYKIPITVSNGTETKTTNIYLKEPLRKIGEYADYLDLTNGKVTRYVTEVVFTGSETWSKYTSVSNHYQTTVNNNFFDIQNNLILSNYYNNTNTKIYYYSSADYDVISADAYRIRFKNKDIETLEEWKNHVLNKYNSGIPIKVVYVLMAPTEESIDVPEIPSLTGNVTYSIGTSIKPSSINYTTR